MPTLLDSADRDALVKRLRQLQPSSKSLWGKFTAHGMVCHLADALRIGLGDLTAKPVDTLPSRTLLKWLVVYSPLSPPRGKIETAPEMLSAAPTTWTDDLATLEKLIERMASTACAARHPTFGPLTHEGWCRLTWKHADHHLRQFGC